MNYLDPLLRRYCIEMNKGACKKRHKIQPYDLFKADIYALGISFYEIISGEKCENIKGINESKENLKLCYEKIHKFQMPLMIKQALLHMLSFE